MICESVPLNEVFPHIAAALPSTRRSRILTTILRGGRAGTASPGGGGREASRVLEALDDGGSPIELELVDDPCPPELCIPLLRRRTPAASASGLRPPAAAARGFSAAFYPAGRA